MSEMFDKLAAAFAEMDRPPQPGESDMTIFDDGGRLYERARFRRELTTDEKWLLADYMFQKYGVNARMLIEPGSPS